MKLVPSNSHVFAACLAALSASALPATAFAQSRAKAAAAGSLTGARGEVAAERTSARATSSRKRTHDGFFFNGGLGFGAGTEVQASVQLILGGTLLPGLVVGGGAIGDPGLGVFGPFVRYYPDPKEGLYAQLMVGPATATGDFDDEDDDQGVGAGVSAGAGYDFWIGDEWSAGVLGRVTFISAGIVPAVLATITYH